MGKVVNFVFTTTIIIIIIIEMSKEYQRGLGLGPQTWGGRTPGRPIR